MPHRQEKDIVKSHMDKLQGVPNSGVVMDLYEFTNSNRNAGFIFYVNNQDRITFGKGVGGDARGSISGEKICANFLVTDDSNAAAKQEMEDAIRLGFRLKHIGILKPMFVAYNCQISKLISGFGSYDQTFNAWLNKTSTRGKYLIPEEKEMLITACTAVYEMWEKGYTCDNLADRHSYVMIGARLKILPYRLRLRGDHENNIMPLRINLADMIDMELRQPQLWRDPELEDFTTLLRNPHAGIEHILGHPILLTPGRRQIMYRYYGSLRLTNNQYQIMTAFPASVYDPSTMTINCPQKDDMLEAICRENFFTLDDLGAVCFASMVSRHYVERLKRLKWGAWVSILKDDTVDKVLRDAVPRLLSKRYGLDYDDKFRI